MFVACDKDGTLHIHQTQPKQVVSNEKWLCEYCGGYVVVAGNDLNFMRNEMFKKIKLLDTYEVEL